MQPFLDAHLKDGAPRSETPPVTAFETGTNVWRTYDRWPRSCAKGCASTSRALYLQPAGGLGFARAAAGADMAYTSDPAKPVTYVQRPVRPPYQDIDTWRAWLVSDQRNVASRPDVLVWETPPLDKAITVAGAPVANLTLSTTGTDGDFVVKLIDVYPNAGTPEPELRGYQLMVAADIIRGRFRDDPSAPKAFSPGKATVVRLPLPNANHVFLPGHRIMVQVQSSWFPLYDRNPQTFVPNIFYAPAAAYKPATVRVKTAGAQASFVELPVVN